MRLPETRVGTVRGVRGYLTMLFLAVRRFYFLSQEVWLLIYRFLFALDRAYTTANGIGSIAGRLCARRDGTHCAGETFGRIAASLQRLRTSCFSPSATHLCRHRTSVYATISGAHAADKDVENRLVHYQNYSSRGIR